MTFLEALKKVRPRIETGVDSMGSWVSRFICDNLVAVGAGDLRYRVHDQLDGCPSYEGWLIKHHPEVYKSMGPEDVKAGRLAWIDDMIAKELAK